MLTAGNGINRPTEIVVNTSASQVTVTKTISASDLSNSTDVTYVDADAGNFTINNLDDCIEVFIPSWGVVEFRTVTSVTSSSTGGKVTSDTNLLVGDKVTLTFGEPLNYFKLGEYETTLVSAKFSVEVTLVTGSNLELPGFTIYPVIINSVNVGSTTLESEKEIDRPTEIVVNTSASQITVQKIIVASGSTDGVIDTATYDSTGIGTITITGLSGYNTVMIESWGSVHFAK